MKQNVYKTFFILSVLLSSVSVTLAQNERDKGIELYQKGDFKGAIKSLKKVSKDNPSDAQTWYYLGLAYAQLSDDKESLKAFDTALKINPNDSQIHIGLAYVYIHKNKEFESQKEAQKALELNPKNAEAHYILGILSIRNESYNYSYERAKKAIELNPNFASAYRLKAEALVSSYSQQIGTVTKTVTSRAELLKEAADDLEKFLRLSPNNKDMPFLRDYVNSLRFFADYYSKPENQKPIVLDAVQQEEPNSTAIQFTSKPRPAYSAPARAALVSGKVRLVVEFAANGKVGHIMIIKPLGYGLDEEAVKAAKAIKFKPATKDGNAISVIKTIEYSFATF